MVILRGYSVKNAHDAGNPLSKHTDGGFVMGWLIAIVIVAIVIIIAVKKHGVSSYDTTSNNDSSNQNSIVLKRASYPANALRMLEQLPDPDMHTVVDYAIQEGLRFANGDMLQGRGIANNELSAAMEYVQKYQRYVPDSEVFCFHEYICSVTNQAFVDIFLARPDLLYKKRGLVESTYFVNQFEIYCGNQIQTFGDEEDDDDAFVGYAYFLDMWKDFPAKEASQSGASIEQTNWHEVLKWLSNKVNDNTYITYPLRYAQELTRIKDTDLHFVGDFACRVMENEDYVNSDIEQTKEFIRKYILCGDTKFEEMSKYSSTIGVASTTFITAFMTRPELLYKSEELIKLRDFTSQLDVECQNQAFVYTPDGGDIDYKVVREKEREYRDRMINFPAMEADHDNIPIEQTNWHEVVRNLSDRVDD